MWIIPDFSGHYNEENSMIDIFPEKAILVPIKNRLPGGAGEAGEALFYTRAFLFFQKPP